MDRRLWFWALINLTFGIYYRSVINWAIGVFLALLLIQDWWNRKGKKAVRALGDKSRLMLARLVIDTTATPCSDGNYRHMEERWTRSGR